MRFSHLFIRLFAVYGCLFLTSCGDSNTSSKEGNTVVSQHVADSMLTGNFYKRIEGTIADQPVVMHLQCYNGAISGSYYYSNQGKAIALSGHIDSLHPNNLVLTEIGEEEDKHPKLDCVYENGQIKGSWRSADETKSYLIDLKESYPEGSYKFRTIAIEKEVKAVPNSDSSPIATISKHLLLPVGKNEEWLSEQIVKIISDDSTSHDTDITATSMKSNDAFLRDYREAVKGSKDDAFEFSATLNFEDYLHLSILYNENGFVTIDKNFYSYTGGAHGFGGDLYYCLDVQNRKQVKLKDVLTSDSSQLQLIVEAAFRKANELTPTDSLNGMLFENHLATTNNFYFTTKGIGFLYLQYEVASYADGPIFVFVPYSDLKKYLQPAFSERMGLN